MDHLPAVADPHEPIYVPYLGGLEYDGLEFCGYPTRQAWEVSRLLEGDLQGRTATEAAQFLQTWLYFGMLHESLSLDIDDRFQLGDFVRFDEERQEKLISTRPLPELMKSWRQRVKQMNDTKAYYQLFRKAMDMSCSVWRDLMVASNNQKPAQLLGPEILLSIQMLGAALDVGVTEICGSWADYVWWVVPRSSWLMQRMVNQGWCPRMVDQLYRPWATFLYYASLLGPPRCAGDHSKCSAGSPTCVAANVNNEKYVTKHVSEVCTCDDIVIQTGEGSVIANAISCGDIPVIRVKDDGKELVVEVQVRSDRDPVGYTAISHV